MMGLCTVVSVADGGGDVYEESWCLPYQSVSGDNFRMF